MSFHGFMSKHTNDSAGTHLYSGSRRQLQQRCGGHVNCGRQPPLASGLPEISNQGRKICCSLVRPSSFCSSSVLQYPRAGSRRPRFERKTAAGSLAHTLALQSLRLLSLRQSESDSLLLQRPHDSRRPCRARRRK